MWYIYTMKYYSVIKITNNVICSNMHATRDYHTKSEGESHDITFMWYLKYDTKEPIYVTEIDMDTDKRLLLANGEGDGGAVEWEVGISRCKLLYREWINNKVLLQRTGNNI